MALAAGICTTHALRGAGFDVELFEQSGEARSTGYQINVYPNGLYALSKLGLLDALLASDYGGEIRSAPIFDGPTGRLVRTIRTVWDKTGEYTGVSLFRGHLHRVLLDSLRGDGPQYGTGFQGFAQDSVPGRVLVEFSDGHTDRFDLVVGADGVQSQVRRQLFPDHPGVHTRMWALLFAFQIDLSGTSEIERLFAEQTRRGEFPQFIVPGTGVILSHGGGQFAAVIAVLDASDARDVVTPEHAKELARRLVRNVRDLRVHYAVEASYWEEGNPLLWHIGDIEPLSAFGRGAITLCGDAAHPTMPVVAQGANQSFEDAWRLSDYLREVSDAGDTRAIPDALDRYSRERAPHVARIQSEGRRRILPVRFKRLSSQPIAHRMYRGLLARMPQRVFDRFDEHVLHYAIADANCPIERP